MKKVITPSQMTQAEARAWLIEYDGEGSEFWKRLPLSSDFRRAVQSDLRDFGEWEDRYAVYYADEREEETGNE